MFRLRCIKLVFLSVAVVLLSGCISQVSTPNFARGGDVINVGLGGLKRNADGHLILASDLTVTITDSLSVVHSPQVLGVYRVYPDHTSSYSVGAQNPSHPQYGDLVPHDGGVWTTIRLSAPNNAPLPLATGPATLSIVSAKLTQTSKPNEGTYANFPLNILPGTGVASLSDSQNLAYQTDGYLSVKPSATAAVPLGGAQIEIIFDADVTASDPIELRMVPQHHDPNLSLIQSVTDNGNGTKTLLAILTNPNGFVELGSWTQGQSSLYDLEMAIVSDSGGVTNTPNAELGDVFTVTGNSYYIDLNGDVVPGITPVLSNEFF
jgi:hypothetical protein